MSKKKLWTKRKCWVQNTHKKKSN